MKKIEYTCNLCKKICHKTDLMSVYYTSNTEYKLHDVDKSDVHICYNCIDMIQQTHINQ